MGKIRKQDVRGEMRRILSNLDSRWLRAASHSLSDELVKLSENEIGNEIEHVLAWINFFPGEPDLTTFISNQLETRTVYLPRTNEDGTMTFISIGKNWVDTLQSGPFGIFEPSQKSGTSYDVINADRTMILVPGLAFDKDGNRLGRGKGYYDRFMGRRAAKGMIKVGVGWSVQIIENVPSEAQDVSMDWVCHEEGYLNTGVAFDED